MKEDKYESKAQQWELEVLCKNREYMRDVVRACVKAEVVNFSVECIDALKKVYVVYMECSWFSNLYAISHRLNKIEKKHDH